VTSSSSISSALAEYLRSGVWRSRRANFLRLVRHRCERCGSRRCLTVHHLNYNRIDGNELDKDLECLCLICHSREHPGKPVRCGPFFVVYQPDDPDGTPVIPGEEESR